MSKKTVVRQSILGLPNNGFMRKQTAVCLVYVVTGYFFILLIAKDTMKIRMTAPTNAGTM